MFSRKRKKVKQRLRDEAVEADRRRERERMLRDEDMTSTGLFNPTSAIYYGALGSDTDASDSGSGSGGYDCSGSDSSSSDSGGYDSGGSDCGGGFDG